MGAVWNTLYHQKFLNILDGIVPLDIFNILYFLNIQAILDIVYTLDTLDRSPGRGVQLL